MIPSLQRRELVKDDSPHLSRMWRRRNSVNQGRAQSSLRAFASFSPASQDAKAAHSNLHPIPLIHTPLLACYDPAFSISYTSYLLLLKSTSWLEPGVDSPFLLRMKNIAIGMMMKPSGII